MPNDFSQKLESLLKKDSRLQGKDGEWL